MSAACCCQIVSCLTASWTLVSYTRAIVVFATSFFNSCSVMLGKLSLFFCSESRHKIVWRNSRTIIVCRDYSSQSIHHHQFYFRQLGITNVESPWYWNIHWYYNMWWFSEFLFYWQFAFWIFDLKRLIMCSFEVFALNYLWDAATTSPPTSTWPHLNILVWRKGNINRTVSVL